MKIDYVIIGSDLSPTYLDFWPVVSKIWKTVFNITPVLGLIDSEESDLIPDGYGLVKKFKSIPGISTGLQSQIVRLFLTNILSGNVIISDIDMLPLSKKYFIDDISEYDIDKLYVLSSDNAECLRNKEYPMCYNVGSTALFREILELPDSWTSFATDLNNQNLGWSTDQLFLFDKINKFKSVNPHKVVLESRGWSQQGIAEGRIDRIMWGYNPAFVREGRYIDCHMLRPYSDFKSEIDTLVSNLI